MWEKQEKEMCVSLTQPMLAHFHFRNDLETALHGGRRYIWKAWADCILHVCNTTVKMTHRNTHTHWEYGAKMKTQDRS